MLFSHPADFTPVCTTELGTLAKMKPLFDQRGVKLIGHSVDPLKSHMGWIYDINETQDTKVNFPIIADPDRRVAMLYDMLCPEAGDTMTVRSVFVISPDKRIQLTQTYPASTGRNFIELLRVVDSLQLSAHYRVSTPANWRNGDECIVPPMMKDDEATKFFPKGVRKVKPYLRFTPQPNV